MEHSSHQFSGGCFGLMPSLSAQLDHPQHSIRADISFSMAAPPSAMLPLHSLFSFWRLQALELCSGSRFRAVSGQAPGAVEVSSRWRWAAAHDERCHAFALGCMYTSCMPYVQCRTGATYLQHQCYGALYPTASQCMSACVRKVEWLFSQLYVSRVAPCNIWPYHIHSYTAADDKIVSLGSRMHVIQ